MGTQDIPRLQSTYDRYDHTVLGLLVLAGVIAILIALFSVLSSQKGGELIRAKDEQMRTDLAAANERAAKAETTAEGFRRDIALANERAAEANRTAEEEKLARMKIEERLAPRRLTAEQERAIATSLHAFAGQKVILIPYLGDTEGIGLAGDISAALGPKGAGWDVSYFAVPPPQTMVSGILVEVIPDATDKIKDAAKTIVTAVRAERLEAIAQPSARRS